METLILTDMQRSSEGQDNYRTSLMLQASSNFCLTSRDLVRERYL